MTPDRKGDATWLDDSDWQTAKSLASSFHHMWHSKTAFLLSDTTNVVWYNKYIKVLPVIRYWNTAGSIQSFWEVELRSERPLPFIFFQSLGLGKKEKLSGKFADRLVFCYHNCSNVLWEKIVLVWGKKLRKKFANSRPYGLEFVMFSRFYFPCTRTIFSTVS